MAATRYMWDDYMGELRDLACVVSWRVACGTSVCVAPGGWRTGTHDVNLRLSVASTGLSNECFMNSSTFD